MKIEMKQYNQELDSFNEIIEKTVNAYVKAGFRLRFYICATNQYRG